MSVKLLPFSHGSEDTVNRSTGFGRHTDAPRWPERSTTGRGSFRDKASAEVPQGPGALACEARREIGERCSVHGSRLRTVFGTCGRAGWSIAVRRPGSPMAVPHRKKRVEQPHNLRGTPARTRRHNRPPRAREGAR